MMLHYWSDIDGPAFKPPPLVVKEEGAVLEFHDHPQMYNFEVGDQIHYHTRLGTTPFFITEVVPADLKDYPKEMRKVTAKKRS